MAASRRGGEESSARSALRALCLGDVPRLDDELARPSPSSFGVRRERRDDSCGRRGFTAEEPGKVKHPS